MNAQIKLFVLIATCLLVAANWCTPRDASAETIHDLVKSANNGQDGPNDGVIKVGTYTFTFDSANGGVSGDRTWDQVSLAVVGTNGLDFTIDPQLRLDSQGAGVAKTLSIDIKYTATSSVLIGGAGLADNAFAQFKANGAYSQVAETLSNGGMLFVGSGDTNQANVSSIAFAGLMTFDVDNAGKLFTPPRGPGDNQDEAQLSSITNTFINSTSEPATICHLIAGGLVLLTGKHLFRPKGQPAA